MIIRLLKKFKYLLIIITALLGLMSISNTEWNFIRPVGVYWYSQWTQSYNLAVLTKWQLLTEVLGYTKKIMMPSNEFFVFWWFNGLPYVFDGKVIMEDWQYLQWFIKAYYVCSPLIEWSSQPWYPQNCVRNVISSWSVDIFWSFLKSLSREDIYSVYESTVNWWNHVRFWLCISSSELSSSLCFQTNASDIDYHTLWSPSITYWFTTDWFDSINSAYLYDPPSYNSSWWWMWDQDVDVDNSIWWDYVYSTCSYWQIIDYLEEFWYNSYLCYWWLDNFDLYDPSINYSPVPWSWKTLSQILTNAYNNWAWNESNNWKNNWFVFWNWLYQDRFSSVDSWYVSMWSSYPAIYRTWFDLYYRYWWQNLTFDAVDEYCLMKQMVVGENALNKKYTWTRFSYACQNILAWKPWWYDSWDVALWVNWQWVWLFGSWNTFSFSNDPQKAIQEFFNRLVANDLSASSRQYIWIWTLPYYIILFLCALVLFRFIQH